MINHSNFIFINNLQWKKSIQYIQYVCLRCLYNKTIWCTDCFSYPLRWIRAITCTWIIEIITQQFFHDSIFTSKARKARPVITALTNKVHQTARYIKHPVFKFWIKATPVLTALTIKFHQTARYIKHPIFKFWIKARPVTIALTNKVHQTARHIKHPMFKFWLKARPVITALTNKVHQTARHIKHPLFKLFFKYNTFKLFQIFITVKL